MLTKRPLDFGKIAVSIQIKLGSYAIGLLLGLGLLGCQPPEQSIEAKASAELRRLIDTFAGIYEGTATNPLIVKGASPESPKPIFHKIVEINAPQFGEAVLYHQLSRETPNGPAIRQKIYVFDSSVDRPNNRMRSFLLPPGDAFQNLDKSPEKIERLEPTELFSFPSDCYINWRFDASKYIGKLDRCEFQSASFGQKVVTELSYTVDSETFEIFEAMYRENGEPVFKTDPPTLALRLP